MRTNKNLLGVKIRKYLCKYAKEGHSGNNFFFLRRKETFLIFLFCFVIRYIMEFLSCHLEDTTRVQIASRILIELCLNFNAIYRISLEHFVWEGGERMSACN